MTVDLLLIPNVGAEEGPEAAGRGAAARAVAVVAHLWRLLFGPETRFGDAARDAPEQWPAALDPRPERPVFAWLDAPGAATAWLNTDAAARQAADAGRALTGASPAAVLRTHDKAFCHDAALRGGFVPAALRDAIAVLDPAQLADATQALREIEQAVARWPAWMQGRFTLKPRFGCSGRGGASGDAGRVDTPALRAALPRLAGRGGAILEPWLERRTDLSTQLWVGPDGAVTLLGTTEQLLEPSGLYRGNRGTVDSKGRVASATAEDEALREPAAALARAAAERGYTGPCGIDAFVFAGPDDRALLRPTVELNARFTLGTVAIGLVRRALRAVKKGIGLRPGELRSFYFALDAPAGGWPEPRDGATQLVPLWPEGPGPRPALLFARDRDALDEALDR